MERLGLSSDVLQATNPRLIHCSITGFGAGGPYSGRPAYDMVGQALSGIASLFIDPEHPETSGPTIPDNATGLYACYGILGALYEREKTGHGRHVEVNMLEASIAFMPDPFVNYVRMAIDNDRLTRVASSHSFAFRCADGKLLAVHLSSQPKFWEAFVGVLGRPELAEDARFKTREQRIRNYRELCRVLGDAIVTRPRTEWMLALEAADVPFAPIQTIPEVIEDPQVQHLHTFYESRHPSEGRSLDIHRPVLIDGKRQEVAPAPTHGEHTATVLAELGYDAKQIERLQAASVI
jgi:formyl-CoA transferase